MRFTIFTILSIMAFAIAVMAAPTQDIAEHGFQICGQLHENNDNKAGIPLTVQDECTSLKGFQLSLVSVGPECTCMFFTKPDCKGGYKVQNGGPTPLLAETLAYKCRVGVKFNSPQD